eukprot:TRINITY_DN42017_c0_g1_i1.p1 TRINITY_DN42017_c0_g1~~TRINITY_DN42017_c0_g1_i1.p1  ORF type:complete len:485 (-),score=130.88 TRINITY_DN42017_c0_g1_i1:24-1478(-)
MRHVRFGLALVSLSALIERGWRWHGPDARESSSLGAETGLHDTAEEQLGEQLEEKLEHLEETVSRPDPDLEGWRAVLAAADAASWQLALDVIGVATLVRQLLRCFWLALRRCLGRSCGGPAGPAVKADVRHAECQTSSWLQDELESLTRRFVAKTQEAETAFAELASERASHKELMEEALTTNTQLHEAREQLAKLGREKRGQKNQIEEQASRLKQALRERDASELELKRVEAELRSMQSRCREEYQKVQVLQEKLDTQERSTLQEQASEKKSGNAAETSAPAEVLSPASVLKKKQKLEVKILEAKLAREEGVSKPEHAVSPSSASLPKVSKLNLKETRFEEPLMAPRGQPRSPNSQMREKLAKAKQRAEAGAVTLPPPEASKAAAPHAPKDGPGEYLRRGSSPDSSSSATSASYSASGNCSSPPHTARSSNGPCESPRRPSYAAVERPHPKLPCLPELPLVLAQRMQEAESPPHPDDAGTSCK